MRLKEFLQDFGTVVGLGLAGSALGALASGLVFGVVTSPIAWIAEVGGGLMGPLQDEVLCKNF